MNYKNYLYILLFFFSFNCTTQTLLKKEISPIIQNRYINKGFTLVYSEKLFDQKLITKKLAQRDLIIFQKNLKKKTQVKITNILNGKSIIAKVGSNASYPIFYNSVISLRILEELEIDLNEPYVEIISISDNSAFVANKAKTYEEEKQVADKAPVDNISINDLNKKLKKTKKNIKKNFTYLIKVGDFYFKDSAISMTKRINQETQIKESKIKKISSTKYRVYLGPFFDINSLQNTFNDINILSFENIEIIKND